MRRVFSFYIIYLFTSYAGNAQLHLSCTNSDSVNFSCFPGLEFLTSQDINLAIPVSHVLQHLFSEGETLTNGTDIAPGYSDFTCYVPIDGSSRHGYVTINHEIPAGAVSVLEIVYNPQTRTWNKIETKKVDFTHPAIVGTYRPCSGGLSPWGTVFVGEEIATNTADNNSDGYHDHGWLVEIDPTTASVVDHDLDGEPDKLWAMGKMSHENVVFRNDTVAYFGSDQSSGLLFKFVADTPQNFSSGHLYALRIGNLSGLNGTNTVPPSTGIWKEVPNASVTDRNNCISLANAAGATNFYYIEDVDIGPTNGDVFFASKYNTAPGAVYRFTDYGDSISNFKVFVHNDYVYSTEYSGGTQNTAIITDGADNLTFDNEGNLYLLQDGGVNNVWFIHRDHVHGSNEKISVFMRTPPGSEPTGLTFTPDNDFGFISIQHPTASTFSVDIISDTIYWNKSQSFILSKEELLGLKNDHSMIVVHESDTLQNNDTIFFNAQTIFTTQTKTIELINAGNQNIYIDNFSLTDSSQFAVGHIGYMLIPSNNYNTLHLAFTPTFEGNHTDHFTIHSNDSLNTFNLNFKGFGIDHSGILEEQKNQTKIYPNPTDGLINIISSKSQTLSLFDSYGKLLNRYNLHPGHNLLNLSDLKEGMYFIELINPNGSLQKIKIIVM